MTSKASFTTILLVLFVGLLSSCQKENNGNETPDTPVIAHQIPSIDEYMPERLLHLFDSLNVLHRGEEAPTINGSFMTESMNLLIVDKVPESNYICVPGMLPIPYYYEFKEQDNGAYRLTYKKPKGQPGELGFFIEQSDTDSTYFRIKDNTAHFTHDPIAPPYFKSSKFTVEDFKHAYIMGHGDYFTLYFYEIRDTQNGFLPILAVLISGKIATGEEGGPVIEDFWCGIETMKYYNGGAVLNQIIQGGFIPTPGDIIILQSPNTLVEGSYDY